MKDDEILNQAELATFLLHTKISVTIYIRMYLYTSLTHTQLVLFMTSCDFENVHRH